MRTSRKIPLLAAFSFVMAVIGAGEVLCHPARRAVGEAPSDLKARNLSVPYGQGETLSAWMLRGQPGQGAVLLLHGVRADRREMLDRARFLNQLGYAVLLPDLPAHGESSGEYITYGLREAEGVRAAMSFLRHELPDERLGVIGVSLGAASFVLAQVQPAPSAAVLESMFPSITEAVTDRLRLYLSAPGPALAPLLLWQLPWRLSISPSQLQPIAEMATLHSPLLIVAGTADQHTTLAETLRLFEAAPAPKDLWLLQDAAHVDLHAFAPREYEARIGAFLARHLHTPAPT
jgi:fermentation-respiration switch protein FrsA (DUF1100 family)